MNLKRALYDTRQEKRKDFLIGVGLFLGLNILLGAISVGLSYLVANVPLDTPNLPPMFEQFLGVIYLVLYCCPFLLNIGLMIYFGLTRFWIALGMLATFAALLLLVVIAGVVFAAWCFYALSTGGL